jgi:hypothetical protein
MRQDGSFVRVQGVASNRRHPSRAQLVARTVQVIDTVIFAPSVSDREIRFPGNREPGLRRRRWNADQVRVFVVLPSA